MERDATTPAQSVCESIVHAVASHTGQSPDTLEPLLHAIDVDALEAIISGGDGVRVTFEYAGLEIGVTPNGIEVRE